MKMRFPQHLRKIACFVALFATPAASAATCDAVKEAGVVVCTFEPAKADLRLFWRDPEGVAYSGFDRLARNVETKGERLVFAMNAGMYQPDLAPVGLYVEEGRQGHPVNLQAGSGNFGLRPNGVFWIDGNRAGVTETTRFLQSGMKPRFATQSGPMLVIGGRIHPKINPEGTSEKVRNGVGLCEDGRVRFMISDKPVTFHRFATMFRDGLRCPDALFLDGSISALYAPNLGRNDGWRPMGPIVGAVEKK